MPDPGHSFISPDAIFDRSDLVVTEVGFEQTMSVEQVAFPDFVQVVVVETEFPQVGPHAHQDTVA